MSKSERFWCVETQEPQQNVLYLVYKDMSRHSRIDFGLISRELENQVTDAHMKHSLFTDQKIIYILVSLDNTTEGGGIKHELLEIKPHPFGRWKVYVCG